MVFFLHSVCYRLHTVCTVAQQSKAMVWAVASRVLLMEILLWLCCIALQELFGRMMNTMDELDTAATTFRKRYLSSAHGHSVIPGVTPFGNETQAVAAPRSAGAAAARAEGDEFDKLDAAYGQDGNSNAGEGWWFTVCFSLLGEFAAVPWQIPHAGSLSCQPLYFLCIVSTG